MLHSLCPLSVIGPATCFPVQVSQCQEAEIQRNDSTYRHSFVCTVVRVVLPGTRGACAFWLRARAPRGWNARTPYRRRPAKTRAARDQPKQRANVSLCLGRVRENPARVRTSRERTAADLMSRNRK